MKRAAFHNLGCKVNTYELDAMRELLENAGFDIVSFEEEADIYIINTCTVTNIADRKSRQMLHKARKMNPDSIIVAVGCYVQARGEQILKEEGIDLCIGNDHKGQIGQILMSYLEHRQEKELVMSDLSTKNCYERLTISGTGEHTRAFIKIQDGCNQFCSYCIIPYARGRVRSRQMDDVVEEITDLAKAGYKEFVLTGIHLSSYGTDFDHTDIKADRFGPEHLLEIIRRVDSIEGVERIRLGSLEPRIITDDFCQKLSMFDTICPHFHLSLQSGCDNTLKRMNRHYTAADYASRVEIIRNHFTHPAITTDIIVGFPGETEEDFNECLEFTEDIRFFETHIFKYSRRKGTPADRMPGQLTDAVKTERSHRLEEIDRRHSDMFRKYYLDKQVAVLFEEAKDGMWTGHTREYVRVSVQCENDLTNVIKNVHITKINKDGVCLGDIVS